jgi:uncharacterized protein
MIQRLLEKDLILWKDSLIRKPLILRGARQVGKTSLVRHFGKTQFEIFVEINLDIPKNKTNFGDSVSLNDLLNRIAAYIGRPLIPGKTLIFFDEIQESQQLMHMFRFFAEDRPDLHVIAAGSLLEVKLKSEWSFPVGRVEYRYLHPLTFTEYLYAQHNEPLNDFFNQLSLKNNQTWGVQPLTTLYKEYVLVGGMPEATDYYLTHRDYASTQPIYERLAKAYIEDVYKYVERKESYKYYEGILTKAPLIAGKIFVYENFGDLGYKSQEVSNALNNLEKVMLINQIKSLNHLEPTLTVKLKRPRKLIVLDHGMANYESGLFREVINDSFCGRLMEQTVGQALLARSTWRYEPLYYWSRDRDEGSAEVDFVTSFNERTTAIEVKSGKIQQMKSMLSLLNLYPNTIPVRISWDPLGIEYLEFNTKTYKILNVPFYLVDQLGELTKQYE